MTLFEENSQEIKAKLDSIKEIIRTVIQPQTKVQKAKTSDDIQLMGMESELENMLMEESKMDEVGMTLKKMKSMPQQDRRTTLQPRTTFLGRRTSTSGSSRSS